MKTPTIEQLYQYAKFATLTYTIPGKDPNKHDPKTDGRIDVSEMKFSDYKTDYIKYSQL